MAPELLQYQLDEQPLVRRGNREPGIAPQGVYRCTGDDQWDALSVVDDEQWQALAALVGEVELSADPELSTARGREAAHDRIDALIERWTSEQAASDVERLLAEHGIPAGVVQGSGQLLQDPQYHHRGFYSWLDHSEVGPTPYAGHQYRIRNYDHGPRTAAPCLGEHTFEVLTELLGLDPDEVAAVAASGALA